MERVVLATGGTGGHIFPAIAVAQEVQERFPKAEIVFLGSSYGPEAALVKKAGFEFIGLPVRGVVGRGFRGVMAAGQMCQGLLMSLRIMHQLKPEVVIGFGGYAAFAGVLAGWLKGAVTAIHEQNAYPGRTNYILSRLVKRVFLSLPVEGSFPAKKTLEVGNPVRNEIKRALVKKREGAAAEPQRSDEKVRLLVMGGSLGAKALNEAVAEGLPMLQEAGVTVWHQTGASHYLTIREAYEQAGGLETERVEAFIENMEEAYSWADLIVCRAGGSTIAEVLVAGVPSLLIPFPYATHNHQWHNAQSLVKYGAARLLEQCAFDGTKGDYRVLMQAIMQLTGDKKLREQMAEACKGLARPQAAKDIVEELELLLSIDQLAG